MDNLPAGFHRICHDYKDARIYWLTAKQIAAVEQSINSNIPSTSSYVRPAVASTAGPSSVPLATVSEHQQVFVCTPYSAQNQRQAKIGYSIKNSIQNVLIFCYFSLYLINL